MDTEDDNTGYESGESQLMEEPSSMLNSNNNLILAHDVMSLKQRATSLGSLGKQEA